LAQLFGIFAQLLKQISHNFYIFLSATFWGD